MHFVRLFVAVFSGWYSICSLLRLQTPFIWNKAYFDCSIWNKTVIVSVCFHCCPCLCVCVLMNQIWSINVPARTCRATWSNKHVPQYNTIANLKALVFFLPQSRYSINSNQTLVIVFFILLIKPVARVFIQRTNACFPTNTR